MITDAFPWGSHMNLRSLSAIFGSLTLVGVVACKGTDTVGTSTSAGGAGASTTAGSGGAGGAAGTTGSTGSTGVGGGGAQGCSGLSPLAEPPEQLYVAPGGSNAAAGTKDAPLASLGEAAKRFSTGGTVIVRGGDYGPQDLDATGTPTHPLVIRAADGETPVFDGATVTQNWSGVIQLWTAENVVLQGLEVKNCLVDNCAGIESQLVSNLSIRNCHIHDINSSGARYAGKKIRLEGNYLHDIALINVNNTNFPNGGWPTCMGTAPDRDNNPSNPFADDVIIRGNRIENCWGEGIGVWFASNAVVEDNIIDNAFNVGIYLDNSFNVTIARNFVHMTRGLNGGQGSGILMGTEPYPSWGLTASSSHDITITNNVVVAGGGIGWWSSDDTTDANTYQHIGLFHNTVVATLGNALGFDKVAAGLPTPSACVAKNNVFSEASDSDSGDAAAWSVGGNAWLGKPKPPIGGATDVTVNAPIGAVTKAADVQSLAALVGTGEAGTGVPADFLCKPRSPTAPSRGAFEQ